MLSTDELEAVILPLAHPLPPVAREAFLAAVASALNGAPTVGPGQAHRIARAILPQFFRPPEPDRPPVHDHAKRKRG